MTFQFRPAERTAAKPLIGFYGGSGSGKTLTALLLARGLAGPKGKIAMIDTEHGRGQLYADVIPGGYSVESLGAPFSPQRYTEILHAAEQEAAVVIIDSTSHEWENVGGVLDMAGMNQQGSGKPGLHNWIEPKKQHQQFLLALLQSPATVICCCRAKHKTRQIKNQNGKTEIVKDDFTTPIQAEEFIFEMTVHAEIMPDHTLRVTKCSHPDLQKIFTDGLMVSVETGKALAEWAKGEGRPAAKPKSSSADANATEALFQTARNKAAEGTAAMRAYWKKLNKADARLLDPLIDELKNAATVADTAAVEPSADELFGDGA